MELDWTRLIRTIPRCDQTSQRHSYVPYFFLVYFLFWYDGIVYGLAAAVFTQNLNRAIETAHKLQAGTAWVSFLIFIYLEKKRKQYLFKIFRPSPLLQGQLYQVPFGGFKQSGIGREMGEYALEKYVNYFLHTVDLPFYSLSALCFSSFSQLLYEYQICTHQPRTSGRIAVSVGK